MSKTNFFHEFKGGFKMTVCLEKQVFEKEVLGLRDLRNSISEVFSKAINDFEEVITGNAKKGGETVSILATRELVQILSAYRFNTEISFDDATNQYELSLNEIKIYASGETKEETLQIFMDLLMDNVMDFFDNLELYMRIPEMKKLYPYYLKIKHCNTFEELATVLNLDEIF